MAVIEGGSNTANKANVTPTYDLQVRTPIIASGAGFVTIAAEVDAGTVTGSRVVRAFDASWDSRLRVGVDVPLFIDRFAGAAQNSTLYSWTVTTMANTQSAGWLTLNSANSIATSAVSRVSSWRSFPVLPTFGTTFSCYAQFAQNPVVNNQCEWGLGIAATTAAATDGVFFRYNLAGEFRAVSVTNQGENTVLIPNAATLVGQSTTHRFSIGIQADVANFFIDNVLVATIPRQSGGDFTTLSAQLPILFRNFNSTVSGPGVAQQMKISTVAVTQQDMNAGKPWADILCGMGMHGSQGQTGGTMGSTATWTNSQAFTAGAVSNTAVLVGTSATTGLGGGFNATAQVTGNTDNIISSFPNPAGTAAVPGRTLYVHGVKVGAINLGAAVATTATALALFVAYGHTGVTLATAEAATTKKPRVVPIGTMAWPVGSAIGSTPTNGDVYMPFTAPIPVAPGEFFVVGARFVVGTATASQTIQFVIGIDSYWE